MVCKSGSGQLVPHVPRSGLAEISAGASGVASAWTDPLLETQKPPEI